MIRASHVAAFGLGAVMTVTALAVAAPKHRFEKLDVFARVLAYVEQNYVEDVDENRLVYGAAKGMVHTLDPHSAFMTPDEYRDMKADTEGEFGGVGVEVDDDGGVIVVIETIPASPAARAGLVKGDRIVAVDDVPTKGQTGSGRLRGRPGTSLALTVDRVGWGEPRRMTLVRELIHVRAVESSLLPGGVGYVRLKQFQERADEEMAAALTHLQSEAGGHLTGLVLDLRGNPGGLLDQAVKISDLFLSSGVIVTTVGRGGHKLDEERARSYGTWDSFPIVCLVNGASASASEIVAGALQDHRRATILGTTTYGKGSVQSIFDLGDGSGLKLTVARYLTPSGRTIQGKGIAPDRVVEAGAADQGDAQLAAAKEILASRAAPTAARLDTPGSER
jgi:carboxyl-terminal processing protease